MIHNLYDLKEERERERLYSLLSSIHAVSYKESTNIDSCFLNITFHHCTCRLYLPSDKLYSIRTFLTAVYGFQLCNGNTQSFQNTCCKLPMSPKVAYVY